MSTPIFDERAFNPKLEGIRTEELVQELVDRKRAHVEQLEAVVALFSGSAATAAPPTNGTAPARARPALRPVPKGRPAKRATTAPDGTSLNDRVIGVLVGAGGQALRTKEITDRLLEAGWTTASRTPMNMVASAVSILLSRGALKRRGDRVFIAPARGVATTSKKTAKRAPPPVRPPEGQRVADFILAALREVGQPSKPADLIEPMKRAGWLSSAKQPEKMIENVLRNLAKKKKAKALGARTFEAVAG